MLDKLELNIQSQPGPICSFTDNKKHICAALVQQFDTKVKSNIPADQDQPQTSF